ncbi:neuroguidin [Lycorma delicatula]|uniref:neuroguidin n=1 Tax=Lycorma delicatula TaxID=130591 RepID=UPI003F50F2AA
MVFLDGTTNIESNGIKNDLVNDTDNITIRTSELFDEINECITFIKNNVIDLKHKIQRNDLSTSEGLSVLEVKNQMLLSYLSNLLYIIMLKCYGKSIAGTVIIDHLVEIRTVIERIRPIENKLKYQIDKLLKVAATGKTDANDPVHYRANPGNMVSSNNGDDDNSDKNDDSSDEEEKHHGDNSITKDGEKSKDRDNKSKAGIYVPPKLAPVHYDGDFAESSKKERLLERARRRALNSSVVQELREEYLDVPTEFVQSTGYKPKISKFAKEKQDYEETFFTRLSSSKQEKHKTRSILKSSLDGLTSFEDISVLDPSSNYMPSKKRKAKPTGIKKKGFKNKKKRFH